MTWRDAYPLGLILLAWVVWVSKTAWQSASQKDLQLLEQTTKKVVEDFKDTIEETLEKYHGDTKAATKDLKEQLERHVASQGAANGQTTTTLSSINVVLERLKTQGETIVRSIGKLEGYNDRRRDEEDE